MGPGGWGSGGHGVLPLGGCLLQGGGVVITIDQVTIFCLYGYVDSNIDMPMTPKPHREIGCYNRRFLNLQENRVAAKLDQ